MTAANNPPPTPPTSHLEVTNPAVVAQIIERAASPGFERWWAQLARSGFCASPVHLAGHGAQGAAKVMGRCKNRRAAVCPSCSQLYAGDTWQLVHAGIAGGHHGLPDTVAGHPMVFATLTAPSFGPVHARPKPGTSGSPQTCHPVGANQHCPHGQPAGCRANHDIRDEAVGQPICADCYDYIGHVLFTWHAPQLWHRFTIRLRRLVAARLTQVGENPKTLRVSYVKVVELQRRAVPHFHTVVRLDATGDPQEPPAPPQTSLGADELAALLIRAAAAVRLRVIGPAGNVVVCFGSQTDAQPLDQPVGRTDQATPEGLSGRRVAAYLAKYVTKSVADFGIATRRISDEAIPELPVTDHIRRILETITYLAELPDHHRMVEWLHTLGYRGHITSKTRRYSTTMGALLAQRAAWRQHEQGRGPGATDSEAGPGQDAEPSDWHFTGYGHTNNGERVLAISAAARIAEQRRMARDVAADEAEEP
ncbi:MAG: replication initiator [Acidimicrobiales bacterium]